MSEIDKQTVTSTDNAVEQLLAKAERRPTPPPEVVARAKQVVYAEWQQTRRRRNQRWYAAAASVVLVAVLWFATGTETAPPAAIELAAIDRAVGEFSYRLDGGVLQRRREQQAIYAGDTIVTDSDAFLGLIWLNGESLRLDVGTTVRFVDRDNIELLAGRIYFDSQTDTPTRAPLLIHTAFGDVRHLGTQFMTDINDTDLLRVSVREGAVAIAGVYHDAEVGVGKQVLLHGSQAPLISNLATHSAQWQWVQFVAPSVDMDGKTFQQVLEWVCRETGLTFNIESSVSQEDLNDPLEGIESDDPMAMLRQAEAASNKIETEQVDGVIVVRTRGM